MNKFTVQKSFAISAGAGSGKTYTLSRRYVNALLGFDYFREDYANQSSFYETKKPARVDEIVTITYTEAAALEMRSRIFLLVSKIIHFDTLDPKDGDYGSISQANAHLDDDARQYVLQTLHSAYTQSTNAKISTIHAFCLETIKANADVARIDVKLDIITEDEKSALLKQIIFDTLNDPKNGDTVLDIASDISLYFLDALILKYVSSSKFRTDYDRFCQTSIDVATYQALIHELYSLPDSSDALIEVENDAIRRNHLERFIANFQTFQACAWKDVSQDKAPTLGAKSFPQTDAFVKACEKFVPIYSTIEPLLETRFFEKVARIQGLLHQIKARYDTSLHDIGKIDFDTIITKTWEIMPQVKKSYRYLMVDEFQDTNAMQFDIVKQAMDQDTNLFVVGDSKQSIYAFQGAQIEVFNQAIQDRALFSSMEPMSANHRSDGVVLDTVNEIFKSVLATLTTLKRISQNYEACAQDLTVFNPSRKSLGSFKFLITAAPQESTSEEEVDELETIAQFIYKVSQGMLETYADITRRIQSNQKAIAIVFDSSTKMLALKQKLRNMGITAKVSASENFYHTKEITEIFSLLKAVDSLSRNPKETTDLDRYYLAAAMRSNMLRLDDNTIKAHLVNRTVPVTLQALVDAYRMMPLGTFIKHVYDTTNLYGVYAHLDDAAQRTANMYKFLQMCQAYENSQESTITPFLSLLEHAIYESDTVEPEAFFKSDSTNAIEICSIHATKGLAYPLVLLGNSEKGLYSQITSDALKHNNFTLDDVNQELVGFKIGTYEPLSLRVLKALDKRKHLAEKKRLLYVALTRAEHHVVISGTLAQNKDGAISLREDSYLSMVIQSLGIEKETLFEHAHALYSLNIKPFCEAKTAKRDVAYVSQALQPLEFSTQVPVSFTAHSVTFDYESARLGTALHRILELYWDRLDSCDRRALYAKYHIQEEAQNALDASIEAFLQSDVYRVLKTGVAHRFEHPFEVEGKKGIIDLIYYDALASGWVIVDFKSGTPTQEKLHTYDAQLCFYRESLNALGYVVSDTTLLWL